MTYYVYLDDVYLGFTQTPDNILGCLKRGYTVDDIEHCNDGTIRVYTFKGHEE
jgi:hypothetical protein